MFLNLICSFFFGSLLEEISTLFLLQPIGLPQLKSSKDHDQLASLKPAEQDLCCFIFALYL